MARVEPDGTPSAIRPGAPRSPDDAAILDAFDDRMALPLVAAAVLPLFLLPGSTWKLLAAAVSIVSWLVFLVDLVVHQRHKFRYLHTWMGRFDLTVVILTAPWFLLTGDNGKFVLIIRLARLVRLVIAGKGARRLLQRVGRVALVALAVVLMGAAAAYAAEHPTNPEFGTYGDAVWWALVTLTTVGYGDVVPITMGGRVVGGAIMITGIGVLGVLAGSLASFFEGGSPEPALPDEADTGGPPPAPGPAPDVVAVSATELGALRDELAAVRLQLAALVSALGDRSDPPADPSP